MPARRCGTLGAMKRHLLPVLAAVLLGASSCSGSEPAVAAIETTAPSETTEESTTVIETETTTTTTVSDTSAAESTTTAAEQPGGSIPLLGEVLSVSEGFPAPVTLWDKSGARTQGALAGPPTPVIEGPIVTLAQIPLQGWVYQREQESNVIYFSDGVTPERELLVGTGEQTLILEGVWLADGDADSAEVLYQRFDPDGQNSIQTLRAYSVSSGDVREITVTGGFESATSFSLIDDRFVAGTFYGEGYYELTSIDLETGDRPYRSSDDDFDCFDGIDPRCPEYDEAIVIGTDIFGFGTVPNPSTGIVDQMGVYRFDTSTGIEEVIASYPWDNGAYYAMDMVLLNNVIAISLASGQFSQGLGEPLPALLFDIGTGETTIAPEPGFVQPLWLS